jgi:hypothetical protein
MEIIKEVPIIYFHKLEILYFYFILNLNFIKFKHFMYFIYVYNFIGFYCKINFSFIIKHIKFILSLNNPDNLVYNSQFYLYLKNKKL